MSFANYFSRKVFIEKGVLWSGPEFGNNHVCISILATGFKDSVALVDQLLFHQKKKKKEISLPILPCLCLDLSYALRGIMTLFSCKGKRYKLTTAETDCSW